MQSRLHVYLWDNTIMNNSTSPSKMQTAQELAQKVQGHCLLTILIQAAIFFSHCGNNTDFEQYNLLSKYIHAMQAWLKQISQHLAGGRLVVGPAVCTLHAMHDWHPNTKAPYTSLVQCTKESCVPILKHCNMLGHCCTPQSVANATKEDLTL